MGRGCAARGFGKNENVDDNSKKKINSSVRRREIFFQNRATNSAARKHGASRYLHAPGDAPKRPSHVLRPKAPGIVFLVSVPNANFK